jgi:hypothetical protein
LIWLNDKNYLAWEFHIKVFIEANGLWGHVDGNNPTPHKDKDKDQDMHAK